LGIAVSPAVCASVPPAVAPDLDPIFSASLSALGGPAELKSLQSVHGVADCAGPRGRYTTETLSRRENKAGLKQTFSDKTREPVSAFVNGDIAWEISRSGQAAPASPMLRSIVRGHQYQMMPVMFESMFHDFALDGVEEFEGRRSVKVRAKNDLGFRTDLYFDAESKLFSGTRMHVPDGSETITTEFSEWTLVGGIKFPSVVTSTDKRGEYVCRFESITLNQVDPALFEVPPTVRAPAADEDTWRAELLALHEDALQAHRQSDVALLLAADSEEFVLANRGVVSRPSLDQRRERFSAYLGATRFSHYVDTVAPVVAVSRDGSLGWVIAQVSGRGTQTSSDGKESPVEFEAAWIELYRRDPSGWKRVGNVSNFKP
jgi:hypothetical protein